MPWSVTCAATAVSFTVRPAVAESIPLAASVYEAEIGSLLLFVEVLVVSLILVERVSFIMFSSGATLAFNQEGAYAPKSVPYACGSTASLTQSLLPVIASLFC